MSDQSRNLSKNVRSPCKVTQSVERYLKEDDPQREFIAAGNKKQDSKPRASGHASENADHTLAEISEHMEEHQSMPHYLVGSRAGAMLNATKYQRNTTFLK